MTTTRRTARVIELIAQDVAFAVRGLRRSPGLATTIVLTLSLGVGANAAVFTAIDRVFLRAPSGIRDPGTLRRLYARIYNQRGPQYGPSGRVTPFLATGDLLALQDASPGIARVAGEYLDRRSQLQPAGRRVRTTFVSPGYFELLGVHPARGRGFTSDESRVPGPPNPAAVIGDGLWRTEFASDSAILGRTLRIDGTIYTIVGVAPPAFEGTELEITDLWVPLNNLGNGDITFLRVIARLEQGVSPSALDQVLTAGYRRAHTADAAVDDSSAILSAPVLVTQGPTLTGVTVLRIPGMPDRNITLLARLAPLALIVLVIAIANMGMLLLMRALRRRREIAIRMALGIPMRRLVLQLMAEGTLLALLSAGAALVVANGAGGVLRAQLSSFRWTATVVDGRAMWFGIATAMLAGILGGLAPALYAMRADVSTSLKSGGDARAGTELRTALLIAQAALCTALLACGGTLLQSLRRAGEFDRGIDAGRAIQLAIPADDANAEPELSRVVERLRALPGVEVVGRTLTPLGRIGLASKVGPNASDTIGLGSRGPSVEFVDREFHRATGMRVVAGRDLSASDDFALVALVNESLARALFPGGKALGSCIHVREPNSPCRTVIGVLHDLRWDVTEPALYEVYLPLRQAWTLPNRALIPNYLFVRMKRRTTPADVATLRATIAPLMTHPEEASVRRLDDLLAPQLRPWRLGAALFLGLGVLGLLAAAIGIFGAISFDVTQRSRDIGIRLALGATGSRILGLVVGNGLRVVVIGAGAGLLVAFGLGRAMLSLLFETTPFDPLVLGATTLVLVLAAALACVVPALRATRVDPVTVLSSD